MTVREMLSRMTSAEYRDWLRFYSVEPWGTEAEDWRATLLINTVRGSVGGKAIEQRELFPWSKAVYDEALATEKQKEEALRARLTAASTPEARARTEAALDRFFNAHNEAVEASSS